MILHRFKNFRLIFLVFISSLFASCEETLLETDISESTLQLLAPSDGSVIDFTSINFDWVPVEEADQYQIQIATPNFENPVQIVEDVILDSITTFSSQLSPSFYQWRVKAINSAYETPYTTASFEIRNNEEFSANMVELISPLDNLIVNTDGYTLEWNPVLDASQYRIQVIDNSNSQIVYDEATTFTTLVYSFGEGNFSWQVRAERDEEFTQYSMRSILIDQTIPNTPELISPEDETTLTVQDVNFSWSRTSIEGSTELDSLYIYSDSSLETLIDKEEVVSSYQTTLDNGMYYWTMKAFDEAGNQSDNSDIFSFTVDQ